jgi:hypothetical protein
LARLRQALPERHAWALLLWAWRLWRAVLRLHDVDFFDQQGWAIGCCDAQSLAEDR